MSKIKIALLKRKAKTLYKSYHKKLDSYSCGKTLAEEISPELTDTKHKFNEVMTKLKKLDPKCPDTKL